MLGWIRKALGLPDENAAPATREERQREARANVENFHATQYNSMNWLRRAFNPEQPRGLVHQAQYMPEGMDNRRRYSDNHLPPHPPVTVGGMTFHFQNNKAAWDRGGWGGPRQSQPGRVGTYSSTGDLARDEQRLIVKPDGTGIFVVGGNGHHYARGTAVVNKNQVQHLRQHGVPEVQERSQAPAMTVGI